MPEQPSTPVHIEISQLHATTCLSMTQFINGRHCPKLANSIVHQLSLLLAHPDLERFRPAASCINNCWTIGKKSLLTCWNSSPRTSRSQSIIDSPISMNNENNKNFRRQSLVIEDRESAPERRRFSSRELFGTQNEIVIDHHDEEYRLRITSNSKLILTK